MWGEQEYANELLLLDICMVMVYTAYGSDPVVFLYIILYLLY